MSTTQNIETLSKTLSELKPGDGYSVKLIDEKGSLGLYFNLRLSGQYVKMLDMGDNPTMTLKLASWEEPNEYARGEAERLYLLVDAIARFFNTGGEWEMLGIIFSNLQKNGIGTADFRPFQLIRSYLTIDYNETLDGDPDPTYAYEHVYANADVRLDDDTQVIVVHESNGPSVCTYKEIKDDAGE